MSVPATLDPRTAIEWAQALQGQCARLRAEFARLEADYKWLASDFRLLPTPVGVSLLKTELAVGLTLSTLALHSSDANTVARNTANAVVAYDSARRIAEKVVLGRKDSKAIAAQFTRLKAQLAKLADGRNTARH